jgi:hypothetical protein
LWLKGVENPDSPAGFKFYQELTNLFLQRKCTMRRLTQVAQRLDPEVRALFFESVYSQATEHGFAAQAEDGAHLQFEVELFTIAISGDLGEIHHTFSQAEAIDNLAYSPRATGWADEMSNVSLFPLLLHPSVLAQVEPQALWNITHAARLGVYNVSTEDYWKEFCAAAYQGLGESIASAPENPDESTLGIRIMIGVRVTPIDEEELPDFAADTQSPLNVLSEHLPSSHSLLEGNENSDLISDDELDEIFEDLLEDSLEKHDAWHGHMSELGFDGMFTIDPPTSWQSMPFRIADTTFVQSMALAGLHHKNIKTCWVWADNDEQAFEGVAVDESGHQAPFSLPFYLALQDDALWFEQQDFALEVVENKADLPRQKSLN